MTLKKKLDIQFGHLRNFQSPVLSREIEFLDEQSRNTPCFLSNAESFYYLETLKVISIDKACLKVGLDR